LSEELSREVMGLMVERGADVDPGLLPVEPEDVERALHAAEEAHGERLRARQADLQEFNAAVAAARLGSLNATFAARRERRQRLLDAARLGGQDARIVRLHEGALRNLEADHAERVRKVSEGTRLGIEFKEVSAGVVLVTAETLPQAEGVLA